MAMMQQFHYFHNNANDATIVLILKFYWEY